MHGIDRRRLRGSLAGLALVLVGTWGSGAALARTAAERKCEESVQGRIAWDYQGRRTWAAENLRRLCKGATDPAQPGRCFRKVMHGGIDWGGGSRWRWQNALDLCEGVADADRTIRCFQRQVRAGKPWADAIRACTGPPALIAVIPRQPGDLGSPGELQPAPAPATPPAGQGAAQGGSSRTILPDGTVEIAYPDGRRKRLYTGGETTIFPDGTQQTLSYSTAARPPIPPAAPDAAEVVWLEAHSEGLLALIGILVAHDQAAISNYLQFEGPNAGVYEQIDQRGQTLGLLLRD